MLDLNTRLNAFIALGSFFSEYLNAEAITSESKKVSTAHFEEFDQAVNNAVHHNQWFTRENVLYSIKGWADALTQENIINWVKPYNLNRDSSKTIALILAGNIPFVGFHDLLSVLISGHGAKIKLSSSDPLLIPATAKILCAIEPGFENLISFSKEKLENFDAVIATGSNNTSRYFDYYFADYPNIIRKNRNSIAVLKGTESEGDLSKLGIDIFQYFGLGCRSVSKIYVPQNYNFDTFFQAIFKYGTIIEEIKYANNYDYNKAVYLMSEFKLLDNGFLLLKENESLASPIGTLFYEFYEDIDTLRVKIDQVKDQIQCVVSKDFIKDEIPFGQTQVPELWDYADGVDTIEFLQSL